MISINGGSELKHKKSGKDLDLENIETRHGDFGVNSVVIQDDDTHQRDRELNLDMKVFDEEAIMLETNSKSRISMRDSMDVSSDSSGKRGLQDLNIKMKLPQVFKPILTQDTSRKYLPDLKGLKMNKANLAKPKKSVKTRMTSPTNVRELNQTSSFQSLENLDAPKYGSPAIKGQKGKKMKKGKKSVSVKPMAYAVKQRLNPVVASQAAKQGIKIHQIGLSADTGSNRMPNRSLIENMRITSHLPLQQMRGIIKVDALAVVQGRLQAHRKMATVRGPGF